jgi:hypothetical protein
MRGLTLLEAGTSLLLRAPRNRVVRLPANKYGHGFIRAWAKGHRLLEGAGVPVPRFYARESDPNEYLVHEWLPVAFTADKIPALPGNELERVYHGLVEFMKTTWKFRAIGDFGSPQLGWVTEAASNSGGFRATSPKRPPSSDKDRWVLLDFTDAHVPLRPTDPYTTHHAISSTQSPLYLFYLPQQVESAIDRAVAERRAEEFAKGNPALISAEEHGLPEEIESY